MPNLRSYLKSELIVTLFLSVAWLSAGLTKVLDFSGFTKALLTYSVIPDQAVRWLAIPLVLVEAWIGIGLMVPSWRKSAALGGMTLQAGFILMVGLEYLRGSTGSCGCGAFLLSRNKDLVHLVQNLIILVLLFLVHQQKLAKGGESNEEA